MKPADRELLDELSRCIKPWTTLGWTVLLAAGVAVTSAFLLPPALAGALTHLTTAAAMLFFVAHALWCDRTALTALHLTMLPRCSGAIVTLVVSATFLLGVGLEHLTTKIHWLAPESPATSVQMTSLELGIYFISLTLLAPVAEELIFRYSIQRRLQRRVNTTVALLISSALFGLVHGPSLSAIASTFLVGIVAGVLAATLGFVALPIAFHIGWNTSVFLSLLE